MALHFHPDTDLAGRPVLERILADGAYLSQFATGTGNGGLTAGQRGARWQWEHRIFAGAYDSSDATDRPVYGALALDGDPYGPAPRFGSAYLLLRAEVTHRTTFAYPDSVFEPDIFGDAALSVMRELLIAEPQPDPLDRYVEAQVHGGVAVPADVEALVLDPCYRDASVVTTALDLGLRIDWHPGYALPVEGLAAHADYRGLEVFTLAAEVAEEGMLTPAILGRSRGRTQIDAQQLKRLWHCLARFGRQGGDRGRP